MMYAPLRASNDTPPADQTFGHLSEQDLASAVSDAIAFWRTSGVARKNLAQLGQVEVRISDLAGPYLGLAYPSKNLVLVDVTAAGYGWSEMDLLSVVSHEMGHMLGLDEGEDGGVMAPALAAGERHVSPENLPSRYAVSPYAFAGDVDALRRVVPQEARPRPPRLDVPWELPSQADGTSAQADVSPAAHQDGPQSRGWGSYGLAGTPRHGDGEQADLLEDPLDLLDQTYPAI